MQFYKLHRKYISKCALWSSTNRLHTSTLIFCSFFNNLFKETMLFSFYDIQLHFDVPAVSFNVQRQVKFSVSYNITDLTKKTALNHIKKTHLKVSNNKFCSLQLSSGKTFF